jgi:hypothetical protein
LDDSFYQCFAKTSKSINPLLKTSKAINPTARNWAEHYWWSGTQQGELLDKSVLSRGTNHIQPL